MKKCCLALMILVGVLAFSGMTSASLIKIGTASYDSNGDGTAEVYSLIYEDVQKLIWFDYTKGCDSLQNQVNWASGLGGELTVTLDSGFTTDINWGVGWRLPETPNGNYTYGYDGNSTAGFNITTSEMGYLYYMALGNLGYYDTAGNPQPAPSGEPSWGLKKTGPFDNLVANMYWSGSGCSVDEDYAWYFNFNNGEQFADNQAGYAVFALAVRPGQVSGPGIVPLPGAAWLLGSGLVGLVGLRRKLSKKLK